MDLQGVDPATKRRLTKTGFKSDGSVSETSTKNTNKKKRPKSGKVINENFQLVQLTTINDHADEDLEFSARDKPPTIRHRKPSVNQIGLPDEPPETERKLLAEKPSTVLPPIVSRNITP